MITEAIKKYSDVGHYFTENKVKQVIMLYESCLECLHAAETAIQNKDIQERYNNLDKATKIITGLQACLDFENGREVAQALDTFYSTLFMKIMNVQQQEDITVLASLIVDVKNVLEAWRDVEMQLNKASVEEQSDETQASPIDFNSGLEISA